MPRLSVLQSSQLPSGSVDVNRLSLLMPAIDIHEIALEMGKTLARIHFRAKRDARDVEFVIGGRDLENYCFFCLDFNQMRPWTQLQELVFFANDPYYPRPGQQYWPSFCLGYTMEAAHHEPDSSIAQQVSQLISERGSQVSEAARMEGETEG